MEIKRYTHKIRYNSYKGNVKVKFKKNILRRNPCQGFEP